VNVLLTNCDTKVSNYYKVSFLVKTHANRQANTWCRQGRRSKWYDWRLMMSCVRMT